MKLLTIDTLEQVREKLHRYFSAVERRTEEVPLQQAVGRYLAEDLAAPADLPERDRSVVDGYAVAVADTFGVSESSPVLLELIGEVEMGREASQRIAPGQAIYTPTGGMLPPGADSVVMLEYAERMDERHLAVYAPAAPGSGVMRRGEDVRKGQVLYRSGHRVTSRDAGMLAAMGQAFLPVFVPPTVAILSTGDEVVSILEEPGPGQVRDINSYALSALVCGLGARVSSVALIRDSREALAEALREALRRSDLVLISGGSSAGVQDHTAQVIGDMGSPGVVTHGIAMKPGKPTIVGIVQDEQCCGQRARLVIGLPGHPLAAVVAFRAVAEDFLLRYYFNSEERDEEVPARLTENVPGGDGRETFVMVRLHRETDGWAAEPIHAKSGAISPFRYADGFLRLPALSEGAAAGQRVLIRRWRGE